MNRRSFIRSLMVAPFAAVAAKLGLTATAPEAAALPATIEGWDPVPVTLRWTVSTDESRIEIVQLAEDGTQVTSRTYTKWSAPSDPEAA